MMEKTFIHATLFSATVVTAYMLLSPPISLSAQNDVVIDDSIRVRKAIIQDVDFKDNVIVVELEEAKGLAVPVITNADTVVSLGNGNATQLPALRPGMPVYIFGEYNQDTRSIAGEKIVIRNKRITERTTLSRAEIEMAKRSRFEEKTVDVRTSTLEPLGLLRAD